MTRSLTSDSNNIHQILTDSLNTSTILNRNPTTLETHNSIVQYTHQSPTRVAILQHLKIDLCLL